MSGHEKKDNADFKVEDRRRFAADGTERRSAEAEAAPSASSSSSASEGPAPKDDDSAASSQSHTKSTKDPSSSASSAGSKPSSLPKIDFSTLLFSLYHAALVHLGEVEEEEAQANLPMAKQSIDLLDVLKQKTKNNLTKEEEVLLDGFLFELRMQFLQKNKKS